MAKSQGDKIDELFKIVHTLAERVDALREEVKGHAPESAKIQDALSGASTKLAVIEQQIVEIRQWKDQLGATELKATVGVLTERVNRVEDVQERSGNRLWTIVPPFIGAIVSGIIAALVAYFIAKK